LALWHEFHAGTVDLAEYHRRGECLSHKGWKRVE
jgi:hypothetical protein